MALPDFARTNLDALPAGDLRFLIEHFPEPGRSYEEIAAVMGHLPSTLESMIESDYVRRWIMDQRTLLIEISPFLLFNVMLRHTLPGERTALDRRVINYIANLLSLFVSVDRLYRVHPADEVASEYLVDMIRRIPESDPAERFAIYAHAGNFALFFTGMFPDWIEHRFRFKRRPVNRDYYEQQGGACFNRAGLHPRAGEYRLKDVFLRLALGFGYYSRALNEMRRRFFKKA